MHLIWRKCRLVCFSNLITANISEILNLITGISRLYLRAIIRNSYMTPPAISNDNQFLPFSDIFVEHFSHYYNRLGKRTL